MDDFSFSINNPKKIIVVVKMDLVVSVVEYSPYRIPSLWPDVSFTLHYQFTRRILHNVERMSTGFGNELDLSPSYEIGQGGTKVVFVPFTLKKISGCF